MLAAITFAVVTTVRPYFPVFASEEFGARNTGVGAVTASFALVPLFLALPVGGWISRWGERPLLGLGTAGLGAGLVVAATSRSLPVLMAAAVVAGFSQMLLMICIQTLVTTIGDSRAREQQLGWFTTAASAGQLVGPLAGGYLADLVGFRLTFLCGALLAGGSALLVRRIETPPVPGSAPGWRAQADRAQELLKLTEMRLAILSSFGLIFALGVHQSFFSVYVTVVRGFSNTTLGMLLAIRSIMSMTVRMFMGPLIARAGGHYRVLLASLAAGGVALGVTSWLEDGVTLALASAVLGLATGLTVPLSMLAAANSVPASERGLAMGVRLTGNRLAELSSPLVFGPLADLLGLGAAFPVAGLLLLAVALWSIRYRHGLDDAHHPARA